MAEQSNIPGTFMGLMQIMEQRRQGMSAEQKYELGRKAQELQLMQAEQLGTQMETVKKLQWAYSIINPENEQAWGLKEKKGRVYGNRRKIEAWLRRQDTPPEDISAEADRIEDEITEANNTIYTASMIAAQGAGAPGTPGVGQAAGTPFLGRLGGTATSLVPAAALHMDKLGMLGKEPGGIAKILTGLLQKGEAGIKTPLTLTKGARFIPGVGAAVGAGLAARKWKQGDYLGAGLESTAAALDAITAGFPIAAPFSAPAGTLFDLLALLMELRE